MEALIARGVSGITSNPTIFEKAIAGSADYDEALRELVAEGKTNDEIYLALVLDDIRRAADLFRPVWDATGGADGYVSLEANPKLAGDTEGTIAEAKMLFKALDRPNVMIKVPATAQGVPAIEALIASGVNVNVTLIFSLAHYEAVVRAYIAGLEKLAAKGGNLEGRLRGLLLREPDRHGGGQEAPGPRESGPPGKGGHRQRTAGLRPLPYDMLLEALGKARGQRGPSAKGPLGEHGHQEPALPRHALRR